MASGTFSLRCFRSLWGAPTARELAHRVGGSAASSVAYADSLLSHIQAQGFDGIEASLADLQPLGGVAHVQHLLAARGMGLVVGVYSGWVDYEDAALGEQFEGVTSHLDRLRQQIEQALDGPQRPTMLNVHAGSDHWRWDEQLEFLARALEIQRELGCEDLLAFETHRGRLFYSPWPTLELLEAFPSLRLTLDFSHWAVVAERMLDTEQDDAWLLERVVPHVAHVHGRVGTAQSSQLPRPYDEETSRVETQRFQRLWDAIWKHQRSEFMRVQGLKQDAAGPRGFATFTPEYGPIPYAPRHNDDPQREAYDVDVLCADKAAEQRAAFNKLFS